MTRPALGRVSGCTGGSRTVEGCITHRGPRDAGDPQRVQFSGLRVRHSQAQQPWRATTAATIRRREVL